MEYILEFVLNNLSDVVLFWTAILLSWGTYLAAFLRYVIHVTSDGDPLQWNQRDEHQYLMFLWGVNVALFAYLFLGPSVVETFRDAMLILDVFLTFLFSTCTYHVHLWWKSNQKLFEQPRTLTSWVDRLIAKM